MVSRTWNFRIVALWLGVVLLGLSGPLDAVPPPRGAAESPRADPSPQAAPAAEARGAAGPAEPAAGAGLRIELRVDPLMALHSWMRKLAEERGEPAQETGTAQAVAVVRRIDRELGGWQGWGLIDGVFDGTKDTATLARIAAGLPEERTLRSGEKIRLRASLTDLAVAYAALEPRFLAETWPGWKKELDREAETLKASFLPKLPQVGADLGRHLEVNAPPEPVPVYLVVEAPFPGAVTFRARGGQVSVLSLVSEPRELHEEMVIHELLHGMDGVTPGLSVLNRLRNRLEAVPGAPPRMVHDYVHTLMFAQAAGTTRALYDPSHKDYGDAGGEASYYARSPESAVVVPAWRGYLEGKTTRDAALDKIAEAFVKAAEKTKGGPEAAPKPKTAGGE